MEKRTILVVCLITLFLMNSLAFAAKKVDVNPAGVYPIVNEPVTLKIAIRGRAQVEDFATNTFTQWYEKKTNVKIEWEVLPESGFNEKLNLMLASGDLPDIFLDLAINPALQMIYGAGGTFVALNDLIDEYGATTKAMFEGSPLVEGVITAPDGNIYALPQVNECYHCFMAQRLWINQPWLDTLGLDMPQSTEEFYQVLKAFKEQDPNGNGKADEIPLAGAQGAWMSIVEGVLMMPFIYNNPFNNAQSLLLKDGVIDAAFTKQEWKDGLAYLYRLHEDGLLSDQSFTQTGAQFKQMGENPDAVILGAAPGGFPGVFTQVYGESGRWLQFKAVPPLEGPNGYRAAAYNPFGVAPGQMVITSACEYPEVAFRWADGFYERETTMRSIFGVLGEHWLWAETGEIGLNGEPAIWKRGKTFGKIQNFGWSQAGISYRPNHLRLGEVDKGPEDLENILYNETKEKYEPYIPPMDEVIPPLFFTADASMELAEMSTVIYDYVNQMAAQFIVGDVDLEKDWDSYLTTLDSMGLARFLEIYQEAYNAKK